MPKFPRPAGSISSVSVIQNECGPTWLSRTASARVAVKGRGATRMFEMRSLQERVPEGGLLPLVGQADDSKSQWEATSQEVCSARRAKEEGGGRSEFPERGFGDKEKQDGVTTPRRNAPYCRSLRKHCVVLGYGEIRDAPSPRGARVAESVCAYVCRSPCR